jgi:hypothetical protein
VNLNTLYFDDITVEEEFRKLILEYLFNCDIYEQEIMLVPMDSDMKTDIYLPAITFDVIVGRPEGSDSEQSQRQTSFSVELNIYTSGEDRVIKNKKLCNELICLLQTNNKLDTYFNLGLEFEENRELGALIEDCYRRVVRLSGICDNETKYISRGDL